MKYVTCRILAVASGDYGPAQSADGSSAMVIGAATMFRKHANFGDFSRSVLISVAAMLLGSLSFGSERAAAEKMKRSDRVDVAIVFAVDRSSLLDSDTVQMVRAGHVAALRSLHDVMTSGPNQCVAVTYREWSKTQKEDVVLPWLQICSETDADAAARAIALNDYGRSDSDLSHERKSFSLSIDAALDELKAASWGSNRRIVNISAGDIVDIIRPSAATTNIIAVQNDFVGRGGNVIATASSSPDYIAAIERTMMFDVGGDRAFFMKPEEQSIRTAKTDIVP